MACRLMLLMMMMVVGDSDGSGNGILFVGRIVIENEYNGIHWLRAGMGQNIHFT